MSRREQITGLALCAVACLQLVGVLSGSRTLQGLGMASAASPAPRVFTQRQGLEAFSSRYSLEWVDRQGEPHTLPLTPERYARVPGPYNRRNPYGAVLAFGPVGSRDPTMAPLFDAVARHGLCGQAPLLRELGVDPASVVGPVRITHRMRTGTDPELPREVRVSCQH